MKKRVCESRAEQIRAAGNDLLRSSGRIPQRLSFIVVDTPELRRVFDEAANEIHYAGACQRVGRCMRLAIVSQGEWVGGMVLGSTFPNIRPRDEAFGLTQFLKNWRERGLVNVWSRENHEYWDNLQLIVNHARTFIFPKFQGNGLGVQAHALLLTEGVRLWEERYGGPVYGFDTLCTHPNSRLFADNGWQLVGRTKGYTRDPSKIFSRRAFVEDWKNIKDNAGLSLLEGSMQWWIWVKVFKRFDAPCPSR